jgi:predicted nucleic acid-binding protein
MAGLTVVDASALIAWLDDTDSHHHAAIELLTRIDSFLVHPITLSEVLVLACARAHDATIATFDQRLSQHAG